MICYSQASPTSGVEETSLLQTHTDTPRHKQPVVRPYRKWIPQPPIAVLRGTTSQRGSSHQQQAYVQLWCQSVSQVGSNIRRFLTVPTIFACLITGFARERDRSYDLKGRKTPSAEIVTTRRIDWALKTTYSLLSF